MTWLADLAAPEAMALWYLAGALLVAIMTVAVGNRWRDSAQPSGHPAPVSVVAGALWPLIVVGLVQYGAILLLATVLRRRITDRQP
ncbi:MAG: hypothetical protein WBB07_23225 [Mycobacterium sp.]